MKLYQAMNVVRGMLLKRGSDVALEHMDWNALGDAVRRYDDRLRLVAEMERLIRAAERKAGLVTVSWGASSG